MKKKAYSSVVVNEVRLSSILEGRQGAALDVGCDIGKQQVWVTGKWYEKFKLGENETTFGWTKEKLESFLFPGSKEMLAYSDAVRAETKKYMEKLTPAELERVIHNEYLGDLPIAKLLARMVIHFSGHIGEMSYIRGLKRGLNK